MGRVWASELNPQVGFGYKETQSKLDLLPFLHTRPFILLKMWTFNDFKPTMMANVIKNLQDRYHIPNHIPIHLPGKFEKCYSGKIMDIGMFAKGLRLSLTTPSVGQLSRAICQPNCSQCLEDIHWG